MNTWNAQRGVLGVVGVLALAAGFARADDVKLRHSAMVAPGAPVLLSDVAELSGEKAQALAGVQVLPAQPRAGSVDVSIADVRQALERDGRVNWGAISLSGRRCSVERVDDAPAKTKAITSEPAPARVDAGPVLKGVITQRVTQLLGVSADDIRLTFDARAQELLATPVSGRTVDLQPTAKADRLPLAIRIFEGEREILSTTTWVKVELRRLTLVLKSAKARGDTISPDDYTAETQWLGPNVDLASEGRAAGSVAKRALSAGQTLSAADVEPAIVVRKGDLVSVSCLAGGIRLKTTARASQDGRTGDVIGFVATDDKKRTFRARVDGPGRAVTAAAGASDSGAAVAETGTSSSTAKEGLESTR